MEYNNEKLEEFNRYINEKKANGSIIPSFVIHMIANLVSSIISLFSLIWWNRVYINYKIGGELNE